MKRLEKSVAEDLINFYSLYSENGLTVEVIDKAKFIESKYLNSSDLISSDVFKLISSLVDFYVDTGIKPLSFSEAEEKLVFLKGRLKELKR